MPSLETTTSTKIIEGDQTQTMLPMEVDGSENDPCDPKEEGFLDEYTEEDDEIGSPSLLNRVSASKLNQKGTVAILQKKRYFFLLSIGVVITASLLSPVLFYARTRRPVLRLNLVGDEFSQDGSNTQSFKIMQITDIHLGEAEDTDWGPRQDEKTFALLEKIFDYEPDCDLLVLGGDQLTANNCQGNCTEYYEILGNFLSTRGVPWATIMGNHDDMDFYVNETLSIPHPDTLRRDLLRVDQHFPLSLSQASAKGELSGVTNYVLDVLDYTTGQPALQIFFLDSGGGYVAREAIYDDQIQWFRQQASLADVPAVLFQHIPTSQHEYVDGSCFGYQGEGVAELEYDAGIADAMIETGRFHFLAVGHNHGNDYCCSYHSNNNDNQNRNTEDLYLCFGRHSGYGGYGKWDRGVRIYELSLTTSDDDGRSDTEKQFQWRTWVRLESGEKVDFMDYDHVNTGQND